MKTILSIFVAVFLSSSILAQKQVTLKYNLDLNKTYRVKSITNQKQKSTMQGVERITEVSNTVYFSLKALNKGNDFFMAQVKFDTILYSINQPPMEINSSKPGDINSEKPEELMNCALNRLCKNTVLVKMAYSGHVIDIMNYDIIAKTVLSDIDSNQNQMAMMIKPRIKMMVEKDAIKGMIESITVNLPNKEVKKGDKWNIQFTNSSGGAGMLVSTDYVLNELKKDKATVSGEIEVEPALGKPTEMNGAEITTEVKGTGKSELNINPKTGWIITGTSEMQLSGNMNIKAQGQEFQMPLEIDINTEINWLE